MGVFGYWRSGTIQPRAPAKSGSSRRGQVVSDQFILDAALCRTLWYVGDHCGSRGAYYTRYARRAARLSLLFRTWLQRLQMFAHIWLTILGVCLVITVQGSTPRAERHHTEACRRGPAPMRRAPASRNKQTTEASECSTPVWRRLVHAGG